MNIVIIEDEKSIRDYLIRKIEAVCPDCIIIKTIASVKEGLLFFEDKTATYDLIFSDIRLTDGLSFEIFENREIEAPIIFTTAYDAYAIRAFEVNGIAYLLKPVSEEALEKSITKYKNLHFSKQENQSIKSVLNQEKSALLYLKTILVQEGQKLKVIQIDDVAYFWAEGKFVYVFTKDKKQHLCDYTLLKLEELLDPHIFYKINRQFIVRDTSIVSIASLPKSKLEVQLTPPFSKEVIVSYEKSSEFKEWLTKRKN